MLTGDPNQIGRAKTDALNRLLGQQDPLSLLGEAAGTLAGNVGLVRGGRAAGPSFTDVQSTRNQQIIELLGAEQDRGIAAQDRQRKVDAENVAAGQAVLEKFDPAAGQLIHQRVGQLLQERNINEDAMTTSEVANLYREAARLEGAKLRPGKLTARKPGEQMVDVMGRPVGGMTPKVTTPKDPKTKYTIGPDGRTKTYNLNNPQELMDYATDVNSGQYTPTTEANIPQIGETNWDGSLIQSYVDNYRSGLQYQQAEKMNTLEGMVNSIRHSRTAASSAVLINAIVQSSELRNSVVREAEVLRQSNPQIYNRFKRGWSKAVEGEPLTLTEQKEILQAFDAMIKGAQQRFNTYRKGQVDLFTKTGGIPSDDAERYLQKPFLEGDGPRPSPEVSAKGWTAPDGTSYPEGAIINQNGIEFVIRGGRPVERSPSGPQTP